MSSVLNRIKWTSKLSSPPKSRMKPREIQTAPFSHPWVGEEVWGGVGGPIYFVKDCRWFVGQRNLLNPNKTEIIGAWFIFSTLPRVKWSLRRESWPKTICNRHLWILTTWNYGFTCSCQFSFTNPESREEPSSRKDTFSQMHGTISTDSVWPGLAFRDE